jgi:hypothetical protein
MIPIPDVKEMEISVALAQATFALQQKGDPFSAARCPHSPKPNKLGSPSRRLFAAAATSAQMEEFCQSHLRQVRLIATVIASCLVSALSCPHRTSPLASLRSALHTYMPWTVPNIEHVV